MQVLQIHDVTLIHPFLNLDRSYLDILIVCSFQEQNNFLTNTFLTYASASSPCTVEIYSLSMVPMYFCKTNKTCFPIILIA